MKKMLILLFAVLSLTACLKNNPYEKVKNGMTKEQVIKLLGKPEEKFTFPELNQPDQKFGSEAWMYDHNKVTVAFSRDSVIGLKIRDKSMKLDRLK